MGRRKHGLATALGLHRGRQPAARGIVASPRLSISGLLPTFTPPHADMSRRRSGRASATPAAAAATAAAPPAPPVAPGSDPLAAALAVAPSVHPHVARLRRDWRFAAVCQFVWSFGDALGVSQTSTAILEHDLSEGGGVKSADVVRKLLRSLTLRPILEASWVSALRAEYARRAPERQAWLGSDAHPREWSALPLTLKVGVLHDLTEWFMREPERFRKLLASDEDLVQWGRIEPVGWDRHMNTYWLFDDNRLWVQYPPPPPTKVPNPPGEPITEPDEPPSRQGEGKAKATGVQRKGRAQGRRSTRNSARGLAPEKPQESEQKSGQEQEEPQLSARELRAQARQQTRASPCDRRSRRVSKQVEEEWEDPPTEWLYDTSVAQGACEKKEDQDGRQPEADPANPAEIEAPGETDVDMFEGQQHRSAPDVTQREAAQELTEPHSKEVAAALESTGEPDEKHNHDAPNASEVQKKDEDRNGIKDEELDRTKGEGKTAEQVAAEEAESKWQEEEAVHVAQQKAWAEWDEQFEHDALALEVPLPGEVGDEGKFRSVEMEVVCVTRAQWEAFAAALRPAEKSKSHRKGANKDIRQDPDEAALHAHLATDVLDRIRADLEAQAKAEAMELALASRKRSSRLVAREEEQQRVEEEAQAQAEAEARIYAARQAEQEAERTEREKVDKSRAREERLRARLEEQQTRREREAEERAERERTREERKRKRDERLSSGAPSTPRQGTSLPDATSPLTPMPAHSSTDEVPASKKAKLDDVQDWEFACEVCGIQGHNLMAKGRTVACESCGVWQHTQCWSKFLNRHGAMPPKWDDAQMVFYCTEHRPTPLTGVNGQCIERPADERQRKHDEKRARERERRLARKSLNSEGNPCSPPANGPALLPPASPSVAPLAPTQAALAHTARPTHGPALSPTAPPSVAAPPPPSHVASTQAIRHPSSSGTFTGLHQPNSGEQQFAPHGYPAQSFLGGQSPAGMPPGDVRSGGMPMGFGPGYHSPVANGRVPVLGRTAGTHPPASLSPGGRQGAIQPEPRVMPPPQGMPNREGASASPLDALAVAAAQGPRLGAPFTNMPPHDARLPAVGNGSHYINGSMNGKAHVIPQGDDPTQPASINDPTPAKTSSARAPSASPTALPAHPTSPTMLSLRRAPSTPGSFPLRYQAKASPLAQPAVGSRADSEPRPVSHGRAPSPSPRD